MPNQPSNSPLRSWLKKHPHPAKLRAWTGEAERVIVIGASASRWRDAELAVGDATRVDALTPEGEVLRSWLSPEEEDDALVPGEPSSAGSAVIDITELARLIAEAGDRGAVRHAEAYKLAYEQQALLVRVLSERLQTLERAWHRLLMSQETAASAEPGALPAGINEQMIMALLGGAFSGGSPKPPQNGAGT